MSIYYLARVNYTSKMMNIHTTVCQSFCFWTLLLQFNIIFSEQCSFEDSQSIIDLQWYNAWWLWKQDIHLNQDKVKFCWRWIQAKLNLLIFWYCGFFTFLLFDIFYFLPIVSFWWHHEIFQKFNYACGKWSSRNVHFLRWQTYLKTVSCIVWDVAKKDIWLEM